MWFLCKGCLEEHLKGGGAAVQYGLVGTAPTLKQNNLYWGHSNGYTYIYIIYTYVYSYILRTCIVLLSLLVFSNCTEWGQYPTYGEDAETAGCLLCEILPDCPPGLHGQSAKCQGFGC